MAAMPNLEACFSRLSAADGWMHGWADVLFNSTDDEAEIIISYDRLVPEVELNPTFFYYS